MRLPIRPARGDGYSCEASEISISHSYYAFHECQLDWRLFKNTNAFKDPRPESKKTPQYHVNAIFSQTQGKSLIAIHNRRLTCAICPGSLTQDVHLQSIHARLLQRCPSMPCSASENGCRQPSQPCDDQTRDQKLSAVVTQNEETRRRRESS